jgi:hypothetical protein
VLGAAASTKGSFQSVLVTLDYSSAQIVYDDGSLDGVALTPVGTNGQAVGQIELTVKLDPNYAFSISSKGASQLALGFNLAASNTVILSAKTVTVNPVIAASALPIDAAVRIRVQSWAPPAASRRRRVLSSRWASCRSTAASSARELGRRHHRQHRLRSQRQRLQRRCGIGGLASLGGAP